MNTILKGAREAANIERLRRILIHNKFYEAALEINEICRGATNKMISDKIENWRNFNNYNNGRY